jgi:hypothetical protein
MGKGVDIGEKGITIITAEDLEIQSLERVGRLAAIQRRISEASGDLRKAIDSASSLRERISNHVDMIDIGERVRGDERERAKEKW